MDDDKLYFIAFAYYGEYGSRPQYHVARRKGGEHFISACGINTLMRGEPDMVKEKEPMRGGKWTICEMCKKNWKKKTGEFKLRKQKRTAG